MKFTILFDNFPYNDKLQTLWGFSCLITLKNKKILFDTGSNGRVLLKNAKQIGINFKDIDILFISHNHWDHIGGLDTIIEENPRITLIVPSTLSKFLLADLKKLVKEIIIIDEYFTKLDNNLYSTGILGDHIKEQSIVIKESNELFIISGCGHPGIDYIEQKVFNTLNRPIKYIIGGFHLMNKTPLEIQKITKNLKSEFITATHCTGDLAIGMLKIQYKNRFLSGGVGAEIRC